MGINRVRPGFNTIVGEVGKDCRRYHGGDVTVGFIAMTGVHREFDL